ncbi:hypothetical protein [Microbacterium sp. 77mftsu3.1]|uniref:hypothetical protein n=1 Tax=Microbacterium sp. 77mftsu3.1 TaxID=1761802 RepID=UPI00088500C7|nr:hypothetical protein [Microbacterium sp. 77mftsu3.1]SDH38603.1 hypothetical protein SAMN04488590_3200 [Microbacterium sp. 77mftsu3.1]
MPRPTRLALAAIALSVATAALVACTAQPGPAPSPTQTAKTYGVPKTAAEAQVTLLELLDEGLEQFGGAFTVTQARVVGCTTNSLEPGLSFMLSAAGKTHQPSTEVLANVASRWNSLGMPASVSEIRGYPEAQSVSRMSFAAVGPLLEASAKWEATEPASGTPENAGKYTMFGVSTCAVGDFEDHKEFENRRGDSELSHAE